MRLMHFTDIHTLFGILTAVLYKILPLGEVYTVQKVLLLSNQFKPTYD